MSGGNGSHGGGWVANQPGGRSAAREYWGVVGVVLSEN